MDGRHTWAHWHLPGHTRSLSRGSGFASSVSPDSVVNLVTLNHVTTRLAVPDQLPRKRLSNICQIVTHKAPLCSHCLTVWAKQYLTLNILLLPLAPLFVSHCNARQWVSLPPSGISIEKPESKYPIMSEIPQITLKWREIGCLFNLDLEPRCLDNIFDSTAPSHNYWFPNWNPQCYVSPGLVLIASLARYYLLHQTSILFLKSPWLC